MNGPGVYTRADLRQLLGYRDARSFRARLAILLAQEAFPQPLPGLPGRWSRVQVDAWIAGARMRPCQTHDGAAHAHASTIAERLARRRLTIIEGGRA